MKKLKTTLKMFFLSFGLFFVFVPQVHAEVIKDFGAQILINTDGSAVVTETIVYDSEGASKHGIYRDITPVSSQGKKMTIKDVSIADTAGTSYIWQRQSNSGDVRLKIGDPDTTFIGTKTYVIQYTATDAVAHLKDTDEIYWNITGNAWPFGIAKVHAQVTLPNGVETAQAACYTGVKGGTEKNCVASNGVFTANRALTTGEGMTVAVGFPKGSIHEPVFTFADTIRALCTKWWPVLIPLIVFVYLFQKWYRKGRDAKGKGVIVPQYEVVDGLTPLDAAVILNQSLAPRDIVAEVLYLATKRYISIARTEQKGFLVTKSAYTLRLEKIPVDELSLADKELLVTLFRTQSKDILKLQFSPLQKLSAGMYIPDTDTLQVGTEVLLSDRAMFVGLQQMLEIRVRQQVVDKGYYTKDFAPKNIFDTKKFIVFAMLFVVFIVLQSTNVLQTFFKILFSGAEDITIVVFVFGVLLAVLIGMFFARLMPAKTTKGALARESLLGLKQYIEVAEKDRIDFHNAPEKDPQLFEQLLPYAIMFGQEKKWAKAFESITISAPSWYHGDTHNFAAVAFVSSLHNDFSSAFVTSIGSAGGSGGGGSSGGGGGGGGGGSW